MRTILRLVVYVTAVIFFLFGLGAMSVRIPLLQPVLDYFRNTGEGMVLLFAAMLPGALACISFFNRSTGLPKLVGITAGVLPILVVMVLGFISFVDNRTADSLGSATVGLFHLLLVLSGIALLVCAALARTKTAAPA